MPHFRLETNVPQEKIPKDFPATLCQIIAKSIGKPVSYCAATVVGGVNMAFGGTTESTAQGVLLSIGGLGVEENKKHAKALYAAVEQALGVPPTRMYISFQNAPPSDVGYNGSTFHDLFG
ncbi:macrophage migration inhibitory factor homolog [Euwallacea similis]|uniref:macrophage migration inhibitory factor homolog n=1 Tax=Euwallacea similis TaxID=1736056 RepID=UPI00344C49BA